MFNLLIAFVVATNIFFYVMGIRMAKEMEINNVSAYRKFGSPKFYFYGINEYKLLFLFILFGDYKRENLNESSLKLVETYKYTFLFNIVLLIIFLIVFVNVNK